MIRQSKPARISEKKLAGLGGKVPWSSITGKRKAVRKKSGKQRRVMGREKIYDGAEKTEQRWKLFVRSGGSRETGLGGRCEAAVSVSFMTGEDTKFTAGYRCNKPITWEAMHWSHKRHAANKDDSLEGGIASCPECHRAQHNPKPCPKKVLGGQDGN